SVEVIPAELLPEDAVLPTVDSVFPDVRESERRIRKRREERGRLPIVGITAEGSEEPEAFVVDDLDEVGAVAEAAPVVVRTRQAGRAESEELLKRSLRRGHVAADLLRRASEEDLGAGGVFLVDRLQAEVRLGVLMEIEERVAD